MRYVRHLGSAWTTPTSVTKITGQVSPTVCEPPKGYTWDPSNGGFWRRLKVGEVAQTAPRNPDGSCGSVDTRAHCVLPGTTIDVDCTKLSSSTQNTDRYRTYLSEQNSRAVAVTAAIRDGGWLTTRANAMSCTFWKNKGAVSKTEPWLAGQGFDILTPPGVVNVYGVPFTVEELQAGSLTRTLVPTPEQKFLIDWAIYTKSQALIAGLIAGKGCGKNVDVPMDHTWGSYTDQTPTDLVLRAIDDHGSSASVSAIAHGCDQGGFTTYIDGLAFNPIQPTAEEWSAQGGLKAYYLRGGYLLNVALTKGGIKLDTAASQGGFPTGIRWSVGYGLCPDATSLWWNGAYVGKKFVDGDFAGGGMPISVVQGNDGDGKGWSIYVAMDPGHTQYTIKIEPTDIGAKNKIVGAIAKAMDLIHQLICTLAPISQPIAKETLLKELCVDASGKTCAKGTAGCKCTAPTTAQKDAVAVSAAVLNYACGKLVETQTPIGPPPSQLPPVPEVTVMPWLPPWWAIALAGLSVGGAVAYSRRR